MAAAASGKTRIGAIRYLNSKPLTVSLPRLATNATVIFDLPSRLADGVAAASIDVALLPAIEFFRHRGYTVVSDTCVACDGPIRSVKLFSRRPLAEVESVALDVASRTSAALVQILLSERFDVSPRFEPLPIGAVMASIDTDAVLLIGDRCMQSPPPGYEQAFDLGELWREWTGLPFVFAMWIARPEVDLEGLAEVLAAARDDGLTQLESIARNEAPRLGLSYDECLVYLRDMLKFRLGPRERQGLELFYAYAVKHHLAPRGAELVFYPAPAHR